MSRCWVDIFDGSLYGPLSLAWICCHVARPRLIASSGTVSWGKQARAAVLLTDGAAERGEKALLTSHAPAELAGTSRRS